MILGFITVQARPACYTYIPCPFIPMTSLSGQSLSLQTSHPIAPARRNQVAQPQEYWETSGLTLSLFCLDSVTKSLPVSPYSIIPSCMNPCHYNLATCFIFLKKKHILMPFLSCHERSVPRSWPSEPVSCSETSYWRQWCWDTWIALRKGGMVYCIGKGFRIK